MLYFKCLQPYFLAPDCSNCLSSFFLFLVAAALPPQPKTKKQRVRKAGIASKTIDESQTISKKLITILRKMFDTKDKDSE